MITERCSAEAPVDRTADTSFDIPADSGTSPDATPTVERVAKVVAGFSAIGDARNALAAAGWAAVVTSNHITVDDEVLVQFIPARTGTYGLISARWIVSSAAGENPIWIVGAGPPGSHTSPRRRSRTPRGGV